MIQHAYNVERQIDGCETVTSSVVAVLEFIVYKFISKVNININFHSMISPSHTIV